MGIRGADDALVMVSGPLRRQVLASLVRRPGAMVTAAMLFDDPVELGRPAWPGEHLAQPRRPPRDDLRRGGLADVPVTQGDGYRLDVSPRDVDAGRFEHPVREVCCRQ